ADRRTRARSGGDEQRPFAGGVRGGDRHRSGQRRRGKSSAESSRVFVFHFVAPSLLTRPRSQKAFVLPLNSESHFEEKASKVRCEYDYYLRKNRLKCRTTQFE